MMNREELIPLLREIACNSGPTVSDVFGHPCYIAIRAINQCFNDIETLQNIIANKSDKPCAPKYDPSWVSNN